MNFSNPIQLERDITILVKLGYTCRETVGFGACVEYRILDPKGRTLLYTISHSPDAAWQYVIKSLAQDLVLQNKWGNYKNGK